MEIGAAFVGYIRTTDPSFTAREVETFYKWYQEGVQVENLAPFNTRDLDSSWPLVQYMVNKLQVDRPRVIRFLSHLESAAEESIIPRAAWLLEFTAQEQEENEKDRDEENIAWLPDVIEKPLKQAAKVTVWVVVGVAALALFAAFNKGKKVFA